MSEGQAVTPGWHVSQPEGDVPHTRLPQSMGRRGYRQRPDEGSQVAPALAWQAGGELQRIGTPDAHEPAWQVSSPLQALPSEHGVPFVTAGCWHAPARQMSDVHAEPSVVQEVPSETGTQFPTSQRLHPPQLMLAHRSTQRLAPLHSYPGGHVPPVPPQGFPHSSCPHVLHVQLPTHWHWPPMQLVEAGQLWHVIMPPQPSGTRPQGLSNSSQVRGWQQWPSASQTRSAGHGPHDTSGLPHPAGQVLHSLPREEQVAAVQPLQTPPAHPLKHGSVEVTAYVQSPAEQLPTVAWCWTLPSGEQSSGGRLVQYPQEFPQASYPHCALPQPPAQPHAPVSSSHVEPAGHGLLVGV